MKICNNNLRFIKETYNFKSKLLKKNFKRKINNSKLMNYESK